MSPVYQRKVLRHSLGRDHLRDTIVGNTTGSCGAGSLYVIDSGQANLAFSGQELYNHAWMRVNTMTLRVATFNTGSGAFLTVQSATTNAPSGGEYEIHTLLSPAEKDRMIDKALRRIPVRREVAIETSTDAHFYAVDNAASPNRLRDVLDIWYYADPTHSLDRDRRRLTWWDMRLTPTGRELHIEPSLRGSQQLVMDAVLEMSLGADDTATVWLPDHDLVLYAAETACWHLLSRGAPGQEVARYRENRKEAAREFSRLAGRFAPQVDRKIELDDPI